VREHNGFKVNRTCETTPDREPGKLPEPDFGHNLASADKNAIGKENYTDFDIWYKFIIQ
jgi:hypothetical protein